MRMLRYSGAIVALALLTVASQPGGAQPYSRQELLNRGNNGWQNNCVVGAMNYYAILQQFPGWPSDAAAQLMRQRIESCKKVGTAGSDYKGDKYGNPTIAPPPPVVPLPPIQPSNFPESQRAKACRAYATTALAQAQAQADGQCNQQGPRWSSNYDVHYNWCMQSGTPQEAQSENDERSKVLNVCVFHW